MRTAKQIFARLILIGSLPLCAQTVTPNIGLQLPIQGTTNWGISLNNNFTLLDKYLGNVMPLPNGLTAPKFNVTGGFQINGNFGISGQVLASTGFGSQWITVSTQIINWTGAWAADTAYAKNDGYVEGGNGYIVTTAYTSGGSFGSLDTSSSVEVAIGCGGTCTISDGGTGGITPASALSNIYNGAGGGTWRRMGVTWWGQPGDVVAQEQTVWGPEGNCQILTIQATCFKRTYSNNTEIEYQESADGIVWSASPGIDTHVGQRPSRVIEISPGSFIMYAANNAETEIDEFTAGYNQQYTLAHSAVITPASAPVGWGTFSYTDNTSVYLAGSTMYLAVDFGFHSGLFSSTDYHTFTPVSLIIPGCSVRSPFYQEAGKWYTWVHCGDNQIHRYVSPGSAIGSAPYTDALGGKPDLSIETANEGAGDNQSGVGQVADPYVLEVQTAAGPKTFLYYTSTQDLGGPTWFQVLKLAIADMPISSVVQTSGGDDVSQLDLPSNLPISMDYANQALNFGSYPIENAGPLNVSGLNIYTNGNPTINFGCFPAQGCNNGSPTTLNFGTADGGTLYQGSIAASPAGGGGMTFTLPRTYFNEGYFFNNQGGTTLLSMDSFSHAIMTASGSVLDDGGGNMNLSANGSVALTVPPQRNICWGSTTPACILGYGTPATFLLIDAATGGGNIQFSGNYSGGNSLASFAASKFGTPVVNIDPAGDVVASGNVTAAGGGNTIYYCSAGASAGNLCRGTGCSCSGGTWTDTGLRTK